MKKIVHLSTAHDIGDDRITLRQAGSLANSGFDVTVIARSDPTFRIENRFENLKFITFPEWKSRADRLIRGNLLAFFYSVKSKSYLVHIHDPELIPLALILRIMGKKIVLDMHEDLAKQVIDKTYLPLFLRRILYVVIPKILIIVSKFFSAVIAATESISQNFPKESVSVIRNLPRLSEFKTDKNYADTPLVVVTGAITRERCIYEILEAFSMLENIDLVLAGPIPSKEDSDYLMKHNLFGTRVKYLGIITRQDVISLLSRAWIGLSLYKPNPNHLEARPAKLYEYFASETAVLASNFPDWETLVLENGAGEVVDPINARDISLKIKEMVHDKSRLVNYGSKGLSMVTDKFTWEKEEEVLLRLYEKLAT